MTYEQFLEEALTDLNGRFPADTQIHIRTVLKNNDRAMDGLVISEPGQNLSPTIYLNGFYRRMEEENASFSDVMDDVVMLYRNNRPAKELDAAFFLEYKNVKPRIIYKLVSRSRNEKLLAEVPHMEYQDLAVVFQYYLDEKSMQSATVLVRNEHCKMWKVDVEELWQVACENTPKLLPYIVSPMYDVLAQMMGVPVDSELLADIAELPLYVTSNKQRMNGAAVMMYPKMLAEFADCVHADVCIIPSSIHELILIPMVPGMEFGDLGELIEMVNTTEVPPEEVLSDHPYFYRRESGEIEW